MTIPQLILSSSKKSSQKHSQEGVSFEEKTEDEKRQEEKTSAANEISLQHSLEEMKKKQAKKDEDPKITKFKNAEVRELLEAFTKL